MLETGRPLGKARAEYAVENVDFWCTHMTGWVLPQGMQFKGCTVPNDDGTLTIYYEKNNGCVLTHERCHVAHGVFHTEAYRLAQMAREEIDLCPEELYQGDNNGTDSKDQAD